MDSMLPLGLCVSPDYFVTKEQEQEESRILGVGCSSCLTPSVCGAHSRSLYEGNVLWFPPVTQQLQKIVFKNF